MIMNWFFEINKLLEDRIHSMCKAVENAECAGIEQLNEIKDLQILKNRIPLLEKTSNALHALHGKEIPADLLLIQTVEDQDCEKILAILQVT